MDSSGFSLDFDEGVTGIPGFKVTIVGGEPDGWSTVTDAEGQFKFEDYPYCQLHTAECRSRRFRVEKAGYETREVGASDPYQWGGMSRGGRKWNAELRDTWDADSRRRNDFRSTALGCAARPSSAAVGGCP